MLFRCGMLNESVRERKKEIKIKLITDLCILFPYVEIKLSQQAQDIFDAVDPKARTVFSFKFQFKAKVVLGM